MSEYKAPKFTEENIIEIVERELPDFAEGCKSEADTVILTQAAFAEDYMMGEFTILAFAVKYAGIKNKTLTIIPHKEESN